MDCARVFNKLVEETANYVTFNKIRTMVLGISGGIDSTIVAAICREVYLKTGVPLIGRSLPIKNKEDEFSVSKLVGRAFCNNFCTVELGDLYKEYSEFMSEENVALLGEVKYDQSPIQEGNIQARLRMMYLYNIAGCTKGMVMSTDNQTEYQLGFWTIHGDVGDFDPIQDLWKTEVFELAEWLLEYYNAKILDSKEAEVKYTKCYEALEKSVALIPTDGLGISNSDLEQIGADSYAVVDTILKAYIYDNNKTSKKFIFDVILKEYPQEVIDNVISRHKTSAFKREKAPIKINLTFNDKMGLI